LSFTGTTTNPDRTSLCSTLHAAHWPVRGQALLEELLLAAPATATGWLTPANVDDLEASEGSRPRPHATVSNVGSVINIA